MNEQFFKFINSKWKFRLYLLKNLPAAFFSGLKVKEFNENKCTITIPYKWLTRNPFKSTYFASLAMAAELSTGIPAMGAVHSSGEKISMLVADIKGCFYKKAVGITAFTCTEIAQFTQTIQQCIASNEAQVFTATSKGYNEQNELVAEFSVSWSFKLKSLEL